MIDLLLVLFRKNKFDALPRTYMLEVAPIRPNPVLNFLLAIALNHYEKCLIEEYLVFEEVARINLLFFAADQRSLCSLFVDSH